MGNPVKVTYVDGSTRLVKAGHFPKQKKRQAREHWRRVRWEALERDGHQCVLCSSGEHLEVHHKTYARRGRELLSDLQTVCRKCHVLHHQWKRRERRAKND